MDILIEVKGTTSAPDDLETVCRFIDMIEQNRWYFGGGIHAGTIRGAVYADWILSLAEVQKKLTDWFREEGFTLDADFGYILETENLMLRQAEFDDWKPMYENVWRHAECARYMLWDVTTSEEEARERMKRTIRYQQNGGLSFIVTKGGEPIGFAGVMEVSPGVYEDTGGCLGPEFQRKGYGGQMLRALEQLVFSRGAEKFIVGHRRENIPSQKVITRCGYRYTHTECKDGRTLDFYEKRRSDLEVKLTYHGHACFTLEYQGVKGVIDPYEWGSVPGLDDLHLTANAVYCSHDHFDHNFTHAVSIHGSPTLPWRVQEFTTPHDDCCGAKRGMNTVRIFHCGGIRVAHLGDIGCYPDGELRAALKNIDCMLIPVGGCYTIDSETAAQIIRDADPKVAIPMHYRTDKAGYDEITHIDDFIRLYPFVKTCEGTFELEEDTGRQILIMK